MHILEAGNEHFEGLVDCQLKVLEGLSALLPRGFIEEKRKRYFETADFRVEALRERGRLNLVACEGDMVVGFALGKIDGGGTSWLTFLGVLPPYRKKGYGEALLKGFIGLSRVLEAGRVSLFTAVELKPAINLYIKYRFTTDGAPKYQSCGVNLYRYERDLV